MHPSAYVFGYLAMLKNNASFKTIWRNMKSIFVFFITQFTGSLLLPFPLSPSLLLEIFLQNYLSRAGN